MKKKTYTEWEVLASDDKETLMQILLASEMILEGLALHRVISLCLTHLRGQSHDVLKCFISKHKVEDKLWLMQKLYSLSKDWATLILQHDDQYWCSSFFSKFTRQNAVCRETFKVLSKMRNVCSSELSYTKFFDWMTTPWIKTLIVNLARNMVVLDMQVVVAPIEMLLAESRRLSRPDHLKLLALVGSVCSVQELNDLIGAQTDKAQPDQRDDANRIVCQQIEQQSDDVINVDAVKAQLKDQTVQHVLKLYQNEKKISLHEWQQLILGVLVLSLEAKKRATLLRLPTGSGKSILTYVLAMILARKTGKQVILAT